MIGIDNSYNERFLSWGIKFEIARTGIPGRCTNTIEEELVVLSCSYAVLLGSTSSSMISGSTFLSTSERDES